MGYLGMSINVILFTTMIFSPSEGLINPSESLQKKSYLLGTLISMYPLGQLFGKSLMGRLSDFFGRKKILIFSLFSSFLFYCIVGYGVQIINFPLIILALLLMGLSEGNIVIAQSVITDQSKDPELRIKRFGMIATMISLSRIIGPLLVFHFKFNSKTTALDFALPFYFIGISFLILLGFSFFLFECQESEKSKPGYLPSKLFINLLEHQKFYKIFLANFLFYLSSSGLFRLYPIYLTTQFHLDTSQLAKAVALNGLGYIIANYLIMPMLKKFSSIFLLIVFSLISSVLMFFLTASFGFNITMILMILASITMGASYTYTIDITAHISEKDKVGEVMGLNSSFNTLSNILIGFLGSYVLIISPTGPMLLSAFFALFAFIAFLKIFHNSKIKNDGAVS